MSRKREGYMEKLIKDRDRVRKHGEVFTPAWVVRDMLNLLPADIWVPPTTFLDPACGNGNFLEQILQRKLAASSTLMDSLVSLSSIYGVDIMADNVRECRDRLAGIWKAWVKAKGIMADEHAEKCSEVILSRNIICGNTLTQCEVDESQQHTGKPIRWTKWTVCGPTLIGQEEVFEIEKGSV